MKKKLMYGFGAIMLAGMMAVVSGCGSEKTTASGTAASGAPASGTAAKTEKVRIGADSGTFSLQFRVAQDKGIFKKYNIDAEITTFSFGIDTLNAILTDRVDVGHAMDYATLTTLGKADLKVFSLISSPKQTNQVLFAKNGIAKPQDLVGKKLGVQKGTVNEYIWGKYFETNQIDKKSVTLVPLQSSAEILAAYERGDVQAAWFGGTFIEKANKVEGSKQLNDLSAINFRMRGYLVGKGSLAKEKPEVVTNLAKALTEASDYIVSHQEEAAELAFKELKLPKEAVLAELKRDWDFDIRFSQEDLDHLKQIQAWSASNGYLKETYELNDKLYVDGLKKAFPGKVTLK